MIASIITIYCLTWNKIRIVITTFNLLSKLQTIDCLNFQGGGAGLAPTDQYFLNFMHFFDKSGKFVCWRSPPGGLAPPPTGNSGSAPEMDSFIRVFPILFLNLAKLDELN